jgi:hypothetical protein
VRFREEVSRRLEQEVRARGKLKRLVEDVNLRG